MRSFRNWFFNTKYRNKVAIVCLVISLLPLLVLGSYSYSQIRDLLITREEEVLAESLDQAVDNLNYKIKSITNMMHYVLWDDAVKNALSKEYDNNFDMYLAYKKVIDPTIITVLSLHEEIKGMTIYSNNNIYPHGSSLRKLDKIKGEKWYGDVLKAYEPILIADKEERKLTLASRQYESSNWYTNIVTMVIDYNELFRSLTKLFDKSYGIRIVDSRDKMIYSFDHFQGNKQEYAMTDEDFMGQLRSGLLEERYVYKEEELKNNGWRVYLYRPIGTVSAAATSITFLVVIIFTVCTLFVIIASYYLASAIVRPVENLNKNMRRIEAADLTVTVAYDSNDEIGDLYRQFNKMVEQLKYLIDEVYTSKIHQQEYEMKALQAQICPHFFYNSLSLINSKAILSGQDEISLMAQHLSTFYRTTLNNGNNMIRVQDEWINVTSYINIQSLMHANSFDVITEIDEDILAYNMPNLLLQPIVENAIGHGIDHKVTEGKGLLTVKGWQNEDTLYFIVEDNGCGMTEETMDQVLKKEIRGYGVRNVHQRVQLTYGEGYGLHYESQINKGTKVTLRIPKKMKQDSI